MSSNNKVSFYFFFEFFQNNENLPMLLLLYHNSLRRIARNERMARYKRFPITYKVGEGRDRVKRKNKVSLAIFFIFW